MKWQILNNKFWSLNVEGKSVSITISDNIIQGDQFSSSRGGFTQRYGKNNTFAGNMCTNSRGIAIGGQYAKVMDNRIVGTDRIAIQAGTASYSSLTDGVHPHSADTIVEGNSGPPPACEIIEGQPYPFHS